VIAFVVVCVGFLMVLALVVQVVDAMGASASRSVAAERRARWEARALTTRAVIARRMPRRVA
jgi:Na+-transporting methylmalonyl-CoA/oxaloacetate decarboxylase gamma subunit